MSIKAEDVIDLLDGHINTDSLTGLPPLIYQLSSHFFPADTRLSVFRSEEHWAVFIEIVCFRPNQDDSAVEIWGYGNCLSGPEERWDDTPYTFCPAAGEDGGNNYPDTPFDFCIVWNGEPLTFTPSPQEYAALGIVIDPNSETNGNHIGGYILRFLCERLDHPFYTSEAELREMLEDAWREGETPRIADMALLWQTSQWRHPDLTGLKNDEERPRHLPYFQALARAIETGDIADLKRQDPATFNTDWRIWDAEERAEKAGLEARQAAQEEAWQQLPPEMQEKMRGWSGPGVLLSVQKIETPENLEGNSP